MGIDVPCHVGARIQRDGRRRRTVARDVDLGEADETLRGLVTRAVVQRPVHVHLHHRDAVAGAGIRQLGLDGERIGRSRALDRDVGITEPVSEREQRLTPDGVVPAVADEAPFEVRGGTVAAGMVLEGWCVLEPARERHRQPALRFDVAEQHVDE